MIRIKIAAYELKRVTLPTLLLLYIFIPYSRQYAGLISVRLLLRLLTIKARNSIMILFVKSSACATMIRSVRSYPSLRLVNGVPGV